MDTATPAQASAALEAGEWTEAERLFSRLVRAQPNEDHLWFGLCKALYKQNRLDEALDAINQAIRVTCDRADLHYTHGNLLADLGNKPGAITAYQLVLKLDPRHAQAHNNLGTLLELNGDLTAAIEHYKAAVGTNPDLTQALANLGAAYNRIDRAAEASAIFNNLLARVPHSPAVWSGLGNALGRQGNARGALDAYLQALQLEPNNPEILTNVGKTYCELHDYDTAIRYHLEALERNPRFVMARGNLAGTYSARGEIQRAMDEYRTALALEPDNVDLSRFLLSVSLYSHMDNDALFEEHRDFARRFQTVDTPLPPPPFRPAAARKLRIGYVSSDFRKHPVAFNLQPVFEHLDRARFEVYLYAHEKNLDETSRWFQQRADAWRPIHALSDEAAARLIRADSIDILVFLASRFDENRPLIARFRPAPIQVSMHDPATIGLDEMDYLIADRQLVPRNSTERFTERVVCLPTFYLHQTIDDAPPPAPKPSDKNGHITFGSFNNPAKINNDVLTLWASVLRIVPNSRLILSFWGSYTSAETQNRVRSCFQSAGIDCERLVLKGNAIVDRASHLQQYAEIDIALDPFPFTGSTTTFEALWMGVPVITLAGERMVARWSTAMLNKLGLSELVAHDTDAYGQIAVALAANSQKRQEWRTTLRGTVATSPLCDAHSRARQLERLYRWMFARHEASQGSQRIRKC